MTGPILPTFLLDLAKANLAAGVAVLAVLALRGLVRRSFGARAAYALWLAPLAAAAAVLAPHPRIVTPMSPMVFRAEAAASTMAEAFTVQAPAQAERMGLDVAPLLFAAWLGGTLALAALLARRQRRFVAAMGRLSPSEAPGVFRAESAAVGPAVVGAWRPRIVAPADFETRFAADERRLILAHEEAHLRRGDATINALACALQCLAWFNPLVHLGARLARVDQELACDAVVIGRFPRARRAYAELLLKTQTLVQPLPLGCHWPSGADHPLKERIAMLKSPLPRRALRVTGLAVAAGLCLGAGSLAWAAQPSHLEPAEAARLVRPGEAILCKPYANRELHNCEIKGSPFASIATAADVQREWPAQAKAAGLTGWVTLQCAPNLSAGRFENCKGYHFGGAAERPDLQAAFEQAAVRVISVIRLKTRLGPNDDVLPPAGFYTIEFNEHPHMPGDLPSGPPVTRFPDFLPGPGGKVVEPAPAHAKTPASYSPDSDKAGSYTPPPGFAEPGTNAAQAPPFRSIWIRKPTGDDLVRLYPASAVTKGLGADVVMSCKVAADGRLDNCDVGRVDITGAHAPDNPADDPAFGAAALELAKLFQMKPVNLQGAPTAGTTIRIPIRFRLPSPPTPATT
ncbi:MAG: TonB family protein [Phenylobacterium sp.]